jgi:DNA-directed RNA polymerase specialized sigma24 family protein
MVDAETNEENGVLPRTHWSKVFAAVGGATADRREASDFLIRRYWKPAFCFIRRCGHGEEEAKDLVQEFFTVCLQNEFFAKADPARGRFRNLLLSSLSNFLHNLHRAEHAQKRQPEGGFVSVHDLATSEGFIFQPVDRETPEAVFHRIWVRELIRRVLFLLENECQATGKLEHYEIFRQRIVRPALEGAEPPSLRNLAQQLGLSEKQAANCLLTARRAYQRLLREEIRLFAGSDEEVAAEIQDLFHFLSSS